MRAVPERAGADVEEAWAGARDIVAETISDHAEVRRATREKALQWGALRSEKIEDAEDERKVYELYYEFEMRRRPAAPAPGPGDQPRRGREGAAGAGERARARLA